VIEQRSADQPCSNVPTVRFCGECGASVPGKFCSECGSLVPDNREPDAPVVGGPPPAPAVGGPPPVPEFVRVASGGVKSAKTTPSAQSVGKRSANIYNSGDYAVECHRCSETAYMSDRVQCTYWFNLSLTP